MAMGTAYIATGSAQTSVSTRRAPSVLRRYFDAFCAWRIRQSLRATLEDLSDRELRDIGVTRGEIDYLVRAAPWVDPRDF
jgi:uncharacterized protein YjiS (DUF1127 family)